MNIYRIQYKDTSTGKIKYSFQFARSWETARDRHYEQNGLHRAISISTFVFEYNRSVIVWKGEA